MWCFKIAAMKKSVPALLLMFFSLSCFCQHARLRISDDFNVSENGRKDQTVSHSVYHDNYFFTCANSGIGGNYKWAFTKLYDLKFAITISKFDEKMNQVKTFDLENGEKEFGPLEPRLLLINNNLYLAYFKSDNKSSFDLYLATVDENSLAIKQTKKICNIQQENVGLFKLESIINAGIVYFANSPDKQKMLIACRATANSLQTFVVDNELNILKQTAIHTSTTGFDISSALITNENLEFLVLTSREETKIIANAADGKKTETKLNSYGSLVPYNTGASLSENGKSIYIYSTSALTDREEKNCNGLLLWRLDGTTLELSRPLTYEFTPDMIEAICKKGGGSKHKREYYLYNFRPELIELDNGNMVIMGCPQQMSISTNMSAPNMNNQSHAVSTTTFNIGPVMAFFLNKSGKKVDYTIIPRNIILSKMASSGSGAIQIVSSPGISRSYSNFVAADLGDEIAIIYNDDEANLKRGEDDKVAEAHSPKNLVLVEALIDKDKKMEYRKQLGENVSGRYTYFLGNEVPSSSASIIFPIAREGNNFNARKTFYSNWCFLDVN